jgi:hypothetical protein
MNLNKHHEAQITRVLLKERNVWDGVVLTFSAYAI